MGVCVRNAKTLRELSFSFIKESKVRRARVKIGNTNTIN